MATSPGALLHLLGQVRFRTYFLYLGEGATTASPQPRLTNVLHRLVVFDLCESGSCRVRRLDALPLVRLHRGKLPVLHIGEAISRRRAKVRDCWTPGEFLEAPGLDVGY